MTIPAILGAALLIGLVLYWLLVTTEGVYLGRGTVIRLYDLTAHRYHQIKQYNPEDEAIRLGEPLCQRLAGIPHPLVVDVATGTGRLPEALLGQAGFKGEVFASDRSFRMLAEARHRLNGQSTSPAGWLMCDAGELPFGASTCDAVCCLEALEFFPDAQAAVAELARLLKPGGVLLTSQRIGMDARLMPGRCWDRTQLLAVLRQHDFTNITVEPWQVIYNLVWAEKAAKKKGSLYP